MTHSIIILITPWIRRHPLPYSLSAHAPVLKKTLF